MMQRAHYVKDTKRFWQERRRARGKLDRKLASLPYSEKLVIMRKMQANHTAIKNAKHIT